MALADGGPQSLRVAAHLRTAIGRGDLKPNEALPSMRELARDLEVAVNTVRAAYDLLRGERFIRKSWRGGYEVVRAEEIPSARAAAIEDQMRTFRAQLAAQGYTDTNEIERAWRASGENT
jgi:GntR family transcriptional regulator